MGFIAVMTLVLVLVIATGAFAAPAPNLALSGTASARDLYMTGSAPTPNYVAQMAADGNLWTYWARGPRDLTWPYSNPPVTAAQSQWWTGWWQLDWATPQTFNVVVVWAYETDTGSFDVPVHLKIWNGSDWTLAKTIVPAHFVWQNNSLPSTVPYVYYVPGTSTTKIRLENVSAFREVQVFNLTEGVTGTVKDANGNPVAGAVVSADSSIPAVGDIVTHAGLTPNPHYAIRRSFGPATYTTTDNEGKYFLPLVPLTYQYRMVAVKTYRNANARVSVNPGAITTQDFTFTADNNLLSKPGVTATASSNAANAIKGLDGNPTTAWECAPTDTDPWIKIDLGADFAGTYDTIRAFIWAKGGGFYHPDRVKVQTSSDGENWTDQGLIAAGNYVTVNSTTGAVTYNYRNEPFTQLVLNGVSSDRYIRIASDLTPVAPNPPRLISHLAELEVYATTQATISYSQGGAGYPMLAGGVTLYGMLPSMSRWTAPDTFLSARAGTATADSYYNSSPVYTIPTDGGSFSALVPQGQVRFMAAAPGYEDTAVVEEVASWGAYPALTLMPTTGNLVKDVDFIGATAASISYLPDGTRNGTLVGSSAQRVDKVPSRAVDLEPYTMHFESDSNGPVSDLTLTWASPKTIDTILIRNGVAYEFIVEAQKPDGTWVRVYTGIAPGDGVWGNEMFDGNHRIAMRNPFIAEFAPITATAIRIYSLQWCAEVEVYNLKGEPSANLKGTVKSAVTGNAMASAKVVVGNKFAYTDYNGYFEMQAPAGVQTLTIDRFPFDTYSQNVTVPSSGIADVGLINLQCPGNIAPFATAYSPAWYVENNPYYNFGLPSYAINENPSGMYYNNNGPWDLYLTWPTPRDLKQIKIAQGAGPNYGNFQTTYIQVYYKVGDQWAPGYYKDGYTYNSPQVLTADLPPIRTDAIRIIGAPVIYEVAVIEGTNTVATPATYAEARTLPDGSLVQLTGSVTGIFSDAGYLEALDRSSGIRSNQGWTFGITKSENLARSADATYDSSTKRGDELIPPTPSRFPEYSPSRAFDGRTNTGWQSIYLGSWPKPSTDWVEVSWPTAKTFDTVFVFPWNNANSATRDLQLQYEDANGNFVTAATVTTPAAYPYNVWFRLASPITTKKVRLYNINLLMEMEIYANGGPSYSTAGSTLDKKVVASGQIWTSGNERYLYVSKVDVLEDYPLGPLAMTNAGLPCNSDAGKRMNVAMLATTWGKINAIVSAGVDVNDKPLSYLYIDDGSAVPSAVTIGDPAVPVTGVRVGPVSNSYITGWVAGDFVRVTGETLMSGSANSYRFIRPRTDSDVTRIN